MLWLHGTYPKTSTNGTTETLRGICSADSGNATTLTRKCPDAKVAVLGIRRGEIGSTVAKHS